MRPEKKDLKKTKIEERESDEEKIVRRIIPEYEVLSAKNLMN